MCPKNGAQGPCVTKRDSDWDRTCKFPYPLYYVDATNDHYYNHNLRIGTLSDLSSDISSENFVERSLATECDAKV